MWVTELFSVWFHEIIWLSWYLSFQVSRQSWIGILRQKNHCRNLLGKRSLISQSKLWLSWSHKSFCLCRKDSGFESNNFKSILQPLNWRPYWSLHIVFAGERDTDVGGEPTSQGQMVIQLVSSRQSLRVNSEKEKWATIRFCFYINKLLPPLW